MKTNRFKTIKTFTNYASKNYPDFWECEDKDIKTAWNYYNSEDAKYNDYSINYCLDMCLEIKEYLN